MKLNPKHISKVSTSERIARWQMALMTFDLTAEHRLGASHSLPDYMSCPPELNEEESIQPEEPQPLTNSLLPPDLVCPPPASLPEGAPVLAAFPAESEDDIVKDLVELTRADPDLGPIWNYLVNKELPSDEAESRRVVSESAAYALDSDQRLYRVIFRPSNPRSLSHSQPRRLCIPAGLRRQVLPAFHDIPPCGHLGIELTFSIINAR